MSPKSDKIFSTCPHLGQTSSQSVALLSDRVKSSKNPCEMCKNPAGLTKANQRWLCLHRECLKSFCGKKEQNHSDDHARVVNRVLTGLALSVLRCSRVVSLVSSRPGRIFSLGTLGLEVDPIGAVGGVLGGGNPPGGRVQQEMNYW
ncbi:MAG: hypothetical protein GY737_22200 [Desulfobacteraceae bacterium]|nr:hypothetical protein [Desulfobacteraceae bacterium]